MSAKTSAPETAILRGGIAVADGAGDKPLPDWITLVYHRKHTCSKKRGKKEFNMIVNEKTLEIKPAWELYSDVSEERGSKCSGEITKHTTEKEVLEKSRAGWTIIKNVEYKWNNLKRDITVTYYHVQARKTLLYETLYERGEYYDRVFLPGGRVIRVYKDRVVEEKP